VVDQANGRVPVMPGCHAFSTKMSIELARYAEDVGADGICLLPPYGMFPIADEALYNHYKDVNEATELPVSIYTEQNVTNDMSLDLLNRLADLPNIMGVKLSTTDMERFQLGVLSLSNRIAVCTGIEQVFVLALALGGLGGYLGTANMVPEFWVKVYDMFMRGNLREALELNKKFTSAFSPIVLKYGFSETIKEALNIRGMNIGQTRRPLTKGTIITPKGKEEIRRMLLDLGIPLTE
jgi:dihydrodipicolinate synthase/N-acetylneuraminate lyase